MSIPIDNYEEKMKKSLSSMEEDFARIRAGRANPRVLDKIKVDYYGTPSNLQAVANISVPEARVLQIQPWEASMVKVIERAILMSDLGLTPTNDGKIIRLAFPELTEEKRRELVKDIKKKGESTKVSIRNTRRDANDTFKKQSKSSEITEDDLKQVETDIQKLTDKYVGEVDKTVEAKSQEVLTI